MLPYSLYRLKESLARDGVHTTLQKILFRLKNRKFLIKEKYFQGTDRDPDRLYALWRQKHALTGFDLDQMKIRSEKFSYRPVVSIVIPVYKPDLPFFQRAVDSVKCQAYPFWQLCLCDDGSKDPGVENFLNEIQTQDSRISVRVEKTNGGIVSASQKAADLVNGEFMAFMDQDDLLTLDALFRVVEKLNEDRNIDLIYSDNDKVDLAENHCEVYFKPDFSPDEFFCHNYIGHLSVLRKSIFDEIGGFLPGFDGAQDFDVLLRAVEKTSRVVHLPYVLYSWRKTPGSTASSPAAKRYAYESGKHALEESFKRKGQKVTVQETEESGLYRCRYIIQDAHLVSVIILTDNRENFLSLEKEIRTRTTYPNIEIIEALFSGGEKSRAFNQAAMKSDGKYLVFLNGNSRIVQKDWVESLLEPAQREGVGVVGAKVLKEDGAILQGGTVLGLGGFLGSAFRGVPEDAVIYNQPHRLIRNCSAVSWDAMLTTKSLFNRCSGFDAQFNELADADFCLRAEKEGAWIVWTPFAVIQNNAASRNGSAKPSLHETEVFRSKWKEALGKPDPFYNVNLSLRYSDFSPDVP